MRTIKEIGGHLIDVDARGCVTYCTGDWPHFERGSRSFAADEVELKHYLVIAYGSIDVGTSTIVASASSPGQAITNADLPAEQYERLEVYELADREPLLMAEPQQTYRWVVSSE